LCYVGEAKTEVKELQEEEVGLEDGRRKQLAALVGTIENLKSKETPKGRTKALRSLRLLLLQRNPKASPAKERACERHGCKRYNKQK